MQPTIREQLAKPFEAEAEFIVHQDRPFVVWAEWDYAEDWSRYPVREVHPFEAYFKGQKVTETEWRALVKAMHAVGSP